MIEFFDGAQMRAISEDEARYRVAEGFEVAAGRCGDACELAERGVAHGHSGAMLVADAASAPPSSPPPSNKRK